MNVGRIKLNRPRHFDRRSRDGISHRADFGSTTGSLALELCVCCVALLALVLCVQSSLEGSRLAPRPTAHANLDVPARHGNEDLSDVSISLWRGPSHGASRVYEITLYGSGVAVFDERQYCETPGRFEFDMQPERLVPLLDALDRLDFMRLDHRCRHIANHTQSSKLTLAIGRRAAEFRAQWFDHFPPDMDPVEIELHRRIGALA
ncbi:MAG: DUF6438 domain-containing protein [Planctomycetota bacterium]|nr:DUF6438 domain-containing protein [Planctomycetota bacterium]